MSRPDLRTRMITRAVRALSRRLKMPAPPVGELVRDRDLPVEMSDGVTLLADCWYPKEQPDAPVILIRTSYGRGGLQGATTAALLALYGFRVVSQSCRGTDGSGGEWEPFVNEAADGAATVEWLRRQPWFQGAFATFGSSYLAYTQWALASTRPPELKAMVPQIAPIHPGAMFHKGGAFAYEVALSWTSVMPEMPSKLRLFLGARRRARALHKAATQLPLIDSYTIANHGRRSAAFESWLTHCDPDDPWWAPVDQSAVIDTMNIPILLQGGWLDLYADEMVGQFQRLKARGVDVALTMAHSSHAGFARALPVSVPRAIEWLGAVFDGRQPPGAGQVLAQDGGTRSWATFDQWPPRSHAQELHLQPGGSLATEQPASAGSSLFRYDPADPTPSIGGELLAMGVDQDNRPLLSRDDVLSYIGAPLAEDLPLSGDIEIDLWFESSLAHADVFVRLCAVDQQGYSRTIGDAIRRLKGLDAGPQLVNLRLSPVNYRVAAGQRLQLLIASGAYPRFLPNPGTGEPLPSARELRVAEQTVYHGPEHPSKLRLPILAGESPPPATHH